MSRTYEGQLEIDHARGVIYFHDAAKGHSLLRICRLPRPIPEGIPLDISHMVGCSWCTTEPPRGWGKAETSIPDQGWEGLPQSTIKEQLAQRQEELGIAHLPSPKFLSNEEIVAGLEEMPDYDTDKEKIGTDFEGDLESDLVLTAQKGFEAAADAHAIETLLPIVDRLGLVGTLTAVAKVCDHKSDELIGEEHDDDRTFAAGCREVAEWRSVARKLERLLERVDRKVVG